MGADPRKLEAAIRNHAGPPSQNSSASATHSEQSSLQTLCQISD